MSEVNSNKSVKVAHLAMLISLLVVLSILEGMLPSFSVPGVKLGLANIVVMYSLFFVNKKSAIFLCFIKACLSFVTRGAMAGILSFSGSFLSILIIVLLLSFFQNKFSYVFISILGAVFHNIGQLIAIYFLLSTNYLFLLPVLLISGVIMGSLTGILLTNLVPYLKTIYKN